MKRIDQLEEFRRLTEAQLSDKIKDSQKQVTLLTQQKVLGTLKNVKDITRERKAIARMKTILDEKVAAKVKSQ